nr:MAG TPA: hypothetical protein [Caudoviricetes sp.]
MNIKRTLDALTSNVLKADITLRVVSAYYFIIMGVNALC